MFTLALNHVAETELSSNFFTKFRQFTFFSWRSKSKRLLNEPVVSRFPSDFAQVLVYRRCNTTG